MTAAAPRRLTDPTPDPTPAPAPRKAPETRANLLRAAREAFARAGFAGARVDQIVVQAGASPRML
ncbi:MAG: AcrR family transcriptional regulator [Paracoccaceae bacterium]|jgi:AcrR family transcriptional regulator